MNRLSKLLVATAAGAALSFAAAASSQAAVYVRIVAGANTINSGALTIGSDDGFAYNVSALNPNLGGQLNGFNSISITGGAPHKKPALHSETTELNSSGNALATIYITRTNLNRPFSSLRTSFNYSTLSNKFTVVASNYIDLGNGLFGGTQVATHSFSGINSLAYNQVTPLLNHTFTPYSFTEKFVVTATGGTSVQAAATLLAVPEPATWALMIGGFGAAGAMIRRRKAVLAA